MDHADTDKEPHQHDYNIVVNGKAKKVDHQVLTFEEVTRLAYPTPPAEGDIVYLVTFHNAQQVPQNDGLVAGQSVRVRNGTQFDVEHSVRS